MRDSERAARDSQRGTATEKTMKQDIAREREIERERERYGESTPLLQGAIDPILLK